MKEKKVRWAYLSLTANGIALCSKIKQHYHGDILTISKRAEVLADKAFDAFEDMVSFAFEQYDCLVFVMATGIVVRSLAGLLKDKTKDPAVLVLDEKGEFCISLLSGHIGGANEFAHNVAEAIGAQAIITTTSDVVGKIAVDTLAQQLGCIISDMTAAKDITAMIVNNESVMVCADKRLELPPCLKQDAIENADQYDGVILVSQRSEAIMKVPFVQLVPKDIVISMGCKKNTSSGAILEFIDEQMRNLGLHKGAIDHIVSADIKAEEEGLIKAADTLGVTFKTISREQIQKAENLFEGSEFVRRSIGVSCVAQPCGYIASNQGEKLLDIARKNGMTISIWKDRRILMGKLYIVSTGPGKPEHMTGAALVALEMCEVVAGYTSYIKNIDSLIEGKEIIKTGMHKEAERCRAAVDIAAGGRTVALVSGGDAGVYGMAGLVLEIVENEGFAGCVDVEVIPGVTSATACAALLGAPLMHDFVLISLSDWLTDIKTIEKRLHCAGQGDFVVTIYNPKSKHRLDIINKAQEILLQHKHVDTPVGIVRNAYRDTQQIELTTLGKMCDSEIDMRTTVLVGNSATYIKDGRMITPRGYKI